VSIILSVGRRTNDGIPTAALGMKLSKIFGNVRRLFKGPRSIKDQVAQSAYVIADAMQGYAGDSAISCNLV
jgi:hypothetical protein